jgi:hypothetical protein
MNTIQEQLAFIEEANKSGNYPEAEVLCRQLIAQEITPEQKVNVLLYLSEALWRKGETHDAMPFANDALTIAQELTNK